MSLINEYTKPNHPLRVLHVTLRMSKQGGGVASYVGELATRLAGANVESVVVSTDGEDVEPLVVGVNDLEWHHGLAKGYQELGYSPEIWRKLEGLVAGVDVVHLHGLRTLLGWKTRRVCERLGKPLVVSPHAQLTPWLLGQRKMKKRMIDWLWLKKTFRAAHSFLAVSEGEAEDIQLRALLRKLRRCRSVLMRMNMRRIGKINEKD